MYKSILTTNLMFDNERNIPSMKTIDGNRYLCKEMYVVDGDSKEKYYFVLRLLEPEMNHIRKINYGFYSIEQSKFIYHFTENYYNTLSTKILSFEHMEGLSSFIKDLLYCMADNLNYLLDSGAISAEEIAEYTILYFKHVDSK